jgi:hypothetical protein
MKFLLQISDDAPGVRTSPSYTYAEAPERMYQPALWHDYFAVVGTGAAALTGLVFVAMTLHLEEVTGDPVHRHRARTILTGLTAVFIRCALVLMGGQSGQAIAIEIIGVLLVVEAILYNSIRQAARSADNGVLWRTIGSFACLVLEQIGALILFSGNAAGLYLVGLGMMSSFIFMVTGAWLLLVGVGAQEAAASAGSTR